MEKLILSLSYGPSPSRSAFPGCFILSGGRIIWASITLLLLFHTVVLVLTVLRVIRKYGYSGHNRKRLCLDAGQRKLEDSSLFRKIYRDGIIVYTYLFGIALSNIIVLNTAQSFLAYSLVSYHRILQAVLTGRLVINNRKAAIRPPLKIGSATPMETFGSNRDIELSLLTSVETAS